jgi:hypothetical protein
MYYSEICEASKQFRILGYISRAFLVYVNHLSLLT